MDYKVLLNKEGLDLLQKKSQYDNTTKDLKEYLIEGFKAKLNVSEEIINDMINLDSNEFVISLTKKEEYYIGDKIKDTARINFSNMFKAKTNNKHYETEIQNEYLCIKKHLGILPQMAERAFYKPYMEEIPKLRSNSSDKKIKEASEIINKNKQIIKEYNEFLKKYAEYRFPVLTNKILRDLSNSIFNKYEIKVEFSDIYYSEKIKIYDIDLIIKIPLSIILDKDNYILNKVIAETNKYIKNVNQYFLRHVII